MQNVATDPIVELVLSGRDVRIEGDAASARLDSVAARLRNHGFGDQLLGDSALADDVLGARINVVHLTAPPGGLSLSALIAQLSGRDRFDDQDDGALEAGFRRLSGVDSPGGRTVLMLDATQGVQRPVLRYLQQVGRTAPALRFVIAAGPELAGLLEAPDMARLRARLEVVIDTGQSERGVRPVAVASRGSSLVARSTSSAVVTVPDSWAIESERRAAMRRRRRTRRVALMWTTSAVALAASVLFGAWLGQAKMTPRGPVVTESKDIGARGPTSKEAAAKESGAREMAVTETRPKATALKETATPDRRAELPIPAVPASAAPPPLAVAVAPAPATVPTQALGGSPVPPPSLAKLTPPEAVASGAPPEAVPVNPDPVIFATAEEHPPPPQATPVQVTPPHAADVRRRYVRPRGFARAHPQWPVERYAEDEKPLPNYGVEELPPEDLPAEPGPRRRRGRYARAPIGGADDSGQPEVAQPYAGADPRGARFDPGDGAPAGAVATGPYGARLFRYGP